MKWDYDKPTEKKTRAEIELTEVFDYVRVLQSKLCELQMAVDRVYFKASVSDSLLVVKKTSEDALKTLNLLNGEEES